MKGINYIYILTVLAIQCRCRKYDIEEEAHKLYGDSFSTVVQKFRKTPEYLKILQSEAAILKKQFNEIKEQIFELRLIDMMPAVLSVIKFNGSKSLLRSQNLFKRYTTKIKRRRIGGKRREQESPVNFLDGYKKLHSDLTVEERNKLKDLAFEYSGKAIHDLLDRWLPDGTQKHSTKLPDGGDQPTKTTTEHVHVATSSTEGSTNSESDNTETSMPPHHHHHSTVAPESLRNFHIPKVN